MTIPDHVDHEGTRHIESVASGVAARAFCAVGPLLRRHFMDSQMKLRAVAGVAEGNAPEYD